MDVRQRFRMVILFSQGILLALTLVLYLIFRRGHLISDLWNGSMDMGRVLYAGLICGIGIRIFSVILSEAWPEFQDNMEDTVIRTLEGIQEIDLLLISVLPAFVEELFFRGFLQPFLGVWLTATIFSVLHWGFAKKLWAHGLHAFLIGLFLGWLYLATGSLFVPMIAHCMNNFLAGLYVRGKFIF